MEVRWEYIEQAVADCQQRMVLHLGVGQRLTTPRRKNSMLQNITDGLGIGRLLKQPKQRKMDMKFGTRNVRSLQLWFTEGKRKIHFGKYMLPFTSKSLSFPVSYLKT